MVFAHIIKRYLGPTSNRIFCLSGLQILLNNHPHGENAQDAEMIPRAELLITMFYGFEVMLNIPLVINHVVPRDANRDDDNEENEDEDGSRETNPSARTSSTFSTDSSEATTLNCDSGKSPNWHFNATFEDSEVDVPRTARRMMGKRKRSKVAVQHSDSTSDSTSQHPAPLRTRSRGRHNQPSPSWTEAPPAQGTPSRKMARRQGKKRKRVAFQDKNLVDSESSDETVLTGGPGERQRKTKNNVTKHKSAIEKVSGNDSVTGRKRKTHKDPAENEDSLSKQEETLHPGSLRQTRKNHEDPDEHKSEDNYSSKSDKCLQKKKGKNVHPQVSEESESSTNKPVTRGEAKKRKENGNKPADPPGAEATPLRKRKRK